MKRILSFVLCVYMMLSFGQIAYANEVQLEDSSFLKGFGLADEISLFEEKGLLKNSNVIQIESVDEKFSLEEQADSYTKLYEEKSNDAVGEEAKEEDVTALLDEYREKNNAEAPTLKSEPISLMAMEASTYASVSYYPGTTIPTYTSITGWPLRDSYTSDNGTVLYSYYYYLDDHFAYIDYLMDYCGWYYYDDSESSDGSYATIYLVKGSDMIAIVADFEYNETVVMVTPTANIEATSISLDISSRTMIVGNQYTLEATIYPSNTTNQGITWSSSNSSVASVSSSGVVTAKVAGSATITAKTSNGKKATCSITVKNLVLAYYPNTQIPTFTSITGKSVYNSTEVDGSMVYSYDLDIESHTDYEAYLVNKDGWTILDEETASDYSYFSALYGKGDVTLFVIADFEQGLTGIVFDAPVTSVAVTGVILNKTSSKMNVGDTMALTATIAPTNATNKTVTWTSSNPSVATVSNGVITAKAAGTTTITATTVDGNKTATCVVTVEDANTTYDVCVYTEAKNTVVQGGQFTFKVYLAGTYDGYSFAIIPENGLNIIDITPANSSIYVDELSDKWLVSVLGDLGKNNSAKEEIVTVTVQVDAAAQLGTRSLSLSNVMISGDSGDKVSNVKYEYASIEITDQIPGDINGDGTFDYYDVSKLFAVFRGKSTIESSVDTDINGDGIFDYYDVSKLFAIHRGKATFN